MSYRINKADLLFYALEGAYTIRGTQSGNLSWDEAEELELDIEELKQRLAVAKAKEKACEPNK